MNDNGKHRIVDHLFRHQYGKMIAILTRLFGISNFDLIEDAVQDTFLKATLKWRNDLPENPEAWLTMAAKNRAIDLMRQVNAAKERHEQVIHGAVYIEINEYFLDHEVEDSQLRMIFLACHPSFSKEEQIVFALKSISGFSLKEIAAALLQKEETIKKRIARARKKIKEQNIEMIYPDSDEIPNRIAGVLQVIYLIFNEGFHSTKPDLLISKDLCGEALRLCKLLLAKEKFRTGSLYALFALLCFHAGRIESKICNGEIIDLKHQDRSKWYMPLIHLGYDALGKSVEFDDKSIYHLEAAIAEEHIKAGKFEDTNWSQILALYDEMYMIMPSAHILLSKASVYLHTRQIEKMGETLKKIIPEGLNQRKYLYHGCFAEYFEIMGDKKTAQKELDLAIDLCSNQLEKKYLKERKNTLLNSGLKS